MYERYLKKLDILRPKFQLREHQYHCTIQVVIPTSSYAESNTGVNGVLHFLFLTKLRSFLKMTKEP